MSEAISSFLIILVLLSTTLFTSCRPAKAPEQSVQSAEALPEALAVESFLADIAQNVAGNRFKIEALMPGNLDPHTYQPTPKDLARIADSQALIVNGAGLEEWLSESLQNAGGQHLVIEASAGLTSREAYHPEEEHSETTHHEGDPHFWLDPINTIHYVENIRDGLSRIDPAGASIYAQNAENYIAQLKALDAWIARQFAQIPPERRIMVTNHESFGYFADRYDIQIVGTILPGVSTNVSPSALQIAELIDLIKASSAPAIFLETGSNPDLAQQIALETGVPVITDLYTHSLSDLNGPAPTYLAMMKHNSLKIIDALK